MEFSTGLATGAHFRFGKKRGFQKGENARTRQVFTRSMQAAFTFGIPKNGAAKLPTDPRVSKAFSGDFGSRPAVDETKLASKQRSIQSQQRSSGPP